jgi:RND family efflux transporter MFP subunit
VAAAEAALERAERNLDRTRIRAPYAGRVRSKRVDMGQYVTPGVSVATVYAVDAAEVRLPLPDDELAYLDLPLDYRGGGTSGSNPGVVLRAEYGGRVHEWKGSIVRTEGEIDPKSRMVHVVASVPDPYREVPGRPPLAVGMFVQAEIRGRTARDVAVLPRAAMRSDGRVWVVDDEDRLRFRDVTVLRADREVVLIADGLRDGERVCLSPMEAATDGMQVRIGDRPTGPEIPAEPAPDAAGAA